MKKYLFLFTVSIFFGFSKNLITVTTKPYEKLIQELAGEGYEVRAFVPADADAHHFHPTTARVQRHAQDSLWLGTGEPFERHLEKTAAFVSLEGKGSDRGNHLWLDPIALKEQLARARDLLSARFSKDSARFEENYRKIAQRLEGVESNVRRKLTHSKPLLAYHPFLDAFCSRFDVELITLEEEGKGMSQKAFEKAAQRVHALGITKLIAAPGETSAGRIAEKLGVEVALLDPYSEDVFDTIEKAAELAAR